MTKKIKKGEGITEILPLEEALNLPKDRKAIKSLSPEQKKAYQKDILDMLNESLMVQANPKF